MTQKNILFWPSHDPRQYSAVADELEFMNPDLNFFFFLLEEPKFEFKYNYITYEQLVDTGSKINKSFYDINLNELLHVDRIHKSLKIAESCLPKYLLSIEKFLIDKNIDCIIGYALSDSITLAVGPVGDFSEKEIKQLEKIGFIPVSIGERILRAETAVISSLSCLRTMAGEF